MHTSDLEPIWSTRVVGMSVRRRRRSKMITAILGTAAAIGLIAAWIFFDSGIWLMEISPKNKKDKKFKDKRLGE